MRVFQCAFRGFLLAIPIHSVSSLMLYPSETADAVEFNEQNGNTYFSLPHLLGRPGETIRHGIVLKDTVAGEDGENDSVENRNILLSPEIERELDIPYEEIHPVPKVLSGTRLAAICGGIRFARGVDSGDSVLLVLSGEYLAGLARNNSSRVDRGTVLWTATERSAGRFS